MPFKNALLLLLVINLTTSAVAQKYLSAEKVEVSKKWNDITFTSTKSFIDNISEAKSLTFFSEILNDEVLQAKLEREEMLTIFAVVDDAFMKIEEKSRDSIISNKSITQSLVRYLTVPGRLDSHSLKMAVLKNGGTAHLSTLNGQNLAIREKNGNLQLIDSENRTATIIASDFYHKNGFFHIVDGLVFPTEEE